MLIFVVQIYGHRLFLVFAQYRVKLRYLPRWLKFVSIYQDIGTSFAFLCRVTYFEMYAGLIQYKDL